MLEELSLDIHSDDISKICDAELPADFLNNIKAFTMFGSASFSSLFLQRFHNLESLHLWSCDVQYLGSAEGDDTVTLSQVKKLELTSIRSLQHIWKKDSELVHILPTLEILEVRGCDDLTDLGVPSTTFQNLTTLKVESCERMKNLVTLSAAQNLVQLTTMRIENCITLTEIVAYEGDEATDKITFSKLQCLELFRLQSLASFCPGNCSIKFPCLQELIVNGCPNLKIFSKGVLSSPQLRRVKESHNDHNGRWAGDLNTTIQQLYTEKVYIN